MTGREMTISFGEGERSERKRKGRNLRDGKKMKEENGML